MNEVAPKPERHQSLGELLAEDRPLLFAWVASLAMHATFMALLYIAPSAGSFDVEFDPSDGVALMATLGEMPERRQVTLPPQVEAVEAEEPEPEEPEAEEPEAEVEPEEPQAEVEPEEPQAEVEPEEPQAEQAEEPEEPRAEVEPEEPRTEAARPEEPSGDEGPAPRDETEVAAVDTAADRDSTPTDPAAMPPRERYPEGTRNPVATDISMWGPEGAQSVMIIRNDRVRASALRGTIEQLVSGLPDFQSLLGDTRIDPFEDVDALLVASTDIRYIQRTFIAGVHRLEPATLMEQLENGYPGGVSWEEQGGRLVGRPAQSRDPRVFMVPTNGLFVFSRPEYLEPMLQGAPTPRGLNNAMDELEARRAAVAAAAEHAERRAQLESELETASTELEATVAELETGFNDGENPCRGMSGPRGRRCRSDRDDDARRWERRTTERRDELAGRVAELGTQLAALPEPPDLGRMTRSIDRADDELPVRDDGWIRGLLEIQDFGGPGREGPAIDWTFQGVRSMRLDGMGDATPPQVLHLSIALDDDATLSGRFVFEDEAQAQTWVDRWPNVISANAAQLIAFGLHRTFAGAEWEVDHNEATFRTTVPAATLNRAAMMIQLAN